MCHTYCDRPPILAVDTPAVTLSMSGGTRLHVSPEEVAFARDLLRAVERFVKQVEAWAVDEHDSAVPVAAGGGEF